MTMRTGLRNFAAAFTMGDRTKRVLVVDDDPEVRELLGHAFRQKGLVVDEAVDGLSAMESLREQQYAIVVLDLIMPRADGFVVVDYLAQSAPGMQPVVLVVTGADRDAIEQLDPRVIHGIVRKPFDVQEVAAIVASCAEIRDRSLFETMALAALIAGSHFVTLLSKM